MEAPAYSEPPPLLNNDPAIANGYPSAPAYSAAKAINGSHKATKIKPSFLSKSCLCITMDSPVIFVHPIGANAGDPIPECTISGYAMLNLTAPKNIKSFTVTLYGTEDIGFPLRGYESRVMFEHELTLPLTLGTNAELPAGSYTFPFQFKVPGTTAPYQRSKYGRTKQRIVARAKGAGMMGGTVEAEHFFDLTCNPAAHDPQRDLALDMQVEDVSNDLGPYRLHLHSPLFVVSGLLSIRFNLPSPPQKITLCSFRVIMEQQWHLTSPTTKDKLTGEPYVEEPPPEKLLVAWIDADHQPDAVEAVCLDGTTCEGVSEAIPGQRDAALARLDPGESWELTHVARLACDDILRPSTHYNTIAWIRTTHTLVFELIYLDRRGIKRSLVVRKNVYVHSCCCVLESVVLPSYKECEEDNSPANADWRRIKATGVCLCGVSFGDLKRTQNPIDFLDNPIVPDVVVPIKPDEDRMFLSAAPIF